MSRVDDYAYDNGIKIVSTNPPYYALLTALVIKSDTSNLQKLYEIFPEEVRDVRKRYNDDGMGPFWDGTAQI